MLRLDRHGGGEDQSSVAREEPAEGCSRLGVRQEHKDLALDFRRGGKSSEICGFWEDLVKEVLKMKNGDLDLGEVAVTRS